MNEEQGEKLQAYDGKDYSEIIEFPVELVDRDGVVRRYSYEESLAVYHRRIQSAPWRYTDDDLIRAEIGHCTRRIEQIKRSYNTRSRRGRPTAAMNPRATLGEGYEMLRRHYDRALGAYRLRLDEELDFTVSLLQDEPACRVYHVGFAGHGGHLLYVYPFDRIGDGDPKEAFVAAQQAFNPTIGGSAVEKMLMAETGAGSGFLLTGTEALPAGLRSQARPLDGSVEGFGLGLDSEQQPWWLQYHRETEEEEAPVSDPDFDEGVAALRAGRNDEAVEAFRLAVERNPYHREAYLALLAVLDGGARYEEADLYGAMAGRHLPGDGLIRYRQGINLVRQGRLDEALVAFDEATVMAPSLYQPPYFAAHVVVAKGGDLDGAIGRLRAALVADEGEAQVRDSLKGLERCRALRRSMRMSAVGLGLLCVAATALGEPLALIGVGVAFACGLAAGPVSAVLARWLLQRGAPKP